MLWLVYEAGMQLPINCHVKFGIYKKLICRRSSATVSVVEKVLLNYSRYNGYHSELKRDGKVQKTSSYAVTKKPRDASCLSVASFIASTVQYLERSFFYYWLLQLRIY